MEFALYGLTFSIIILFVYRMGVSDGARNNVKSPIKVVKDVASGVINHKETKKKTKEQEQLERDFKAMMECSPESMLETVKREMSK